MKKRKLALFALLSVLVVFLACGDEEGFQPKKVKLDTPEAKLSYAVGIDLAQNFENLDMNIDPEVFVSAYLTQAKGEETQMTQEEASKVLMDFREAQMIEQMDPERKAKFLADKQKREEEGTKNQLAGEEFLKENAKKEGIISLKSGLQYKVLKEGTGATPSLESKVRFHYRGTLIDGTQFESSYDKGQPLSYPVKNLVKGWQEALTMMKEGGKWQIYIPSDLGYGERGKGSIGPNLTLIFDIELLKIEE